MSETTRDYRHVEGADVSHAMYDRTNDIASLLVSAAVPTVTPAELSTVVHSYNSGSILDRRTEVSTAGHAGR